MNERRLDRSGEAMVRKPRRDPAVDRLLAGLASSQRDLALALREFLLGAAPELREAIKWGAPCYAGRRLVCALAVHRDHTNLVFYRGASLRDPRHLLEGAGKSMRHVKPYTVADVRPSRLRPLLREALALDAS